MYFELTHGWGTNPLFYMRTTYKDYKKAKKALAFLFDLYQEQLENCAGKGPFVCILKTKGVIYDGINEETKTSQNK